MKAYNEILSILSDNKISFDRYYTIDNLFYICFKSEIELNAGVRKILLPNPLFVSGDIFKQYNQICIDMDKEPGESRQTVGTSGKLKSKSERLKEIENFNLL